MQAVDYKSETPVYHTLRQQFADTSFDLVIDALGVQALFESCPAFLKSEGSFITVGVLYTELSYHGMAGMLYKMAKNILWPAALGGVPRKYHHIASAVDNAAMTRLGALCESGKLRVPVDSVWKFEDALKAYDRMLSQRARGKIVIQL
jgi:NADPH:quinone reductase-like Zn-dependent oxidoreductase